MMKVVTNIADWRTTSDAPPATHWACRPDVYPAYFTMLADPPEMALPVLAVLISDYRETDDPAGHFRDVIAAHGLTMIEAPE